MTELSDVDKFWLECLWDQVCWARRAGNQRNLQWRVSREALNILRTLRTSTGTPMYWSPALLDEPERLFGYPIVLDPNCYGAVLEAVVEHDHH